MPLVRFSIPEHVDSVSIGHLTDAVHDALISAVGIPVADRFHTIERLAPDRLILDPSFQVERRSRDATIVHITLRSGRTDDVKRALYRTIVENVAARTTILPTDIMIVLVENALVDWSFGDGIAHYARE